MKIKFDLKNPYTPLFFSCVFFLVYFFCLTQLDFVNAFRYKYNDLYAKIAYKINPKPKNLDKISLIFIDDESSNKINKRISLDRDVHVLLLDKLKKYHPKLIAFDIVFQGQSSNPEIDDALAYMFEDLGNVILPLFVVGIF